MKPPWRRPEWLFCQVERACEDEPAVASPGVAVVPDRARAPTYLPTVCVSVHPQSVSSTNQHCERLTQ